MKKQTLKERKELVIGSIRDMLQEEFEGSFLITQNDDFFIGIKKLVSIEVEKNGEKDLFSEDAEVNLYLSDGDCESYSTSANDYSINKLNAIADQIVRYGRIEQMK